MKKILWPLFWCRLYWLFMVLAAILCAIHLHVSGATVKFLIYNLFYNPPSTPWYEAARLMGGLAAASFLAGFVSALDDDDTTSRGKPVGVELYEKLRGYCRETLLEAGGNYSSIARERSAQACGLFCFTGRHNNKFCDNEKPPSRSNKAEKAQTAMRI